jgi:hypothetical protein
MLNPLSGLVAWEHCGAIAELTENYPLRHTCDNANTRSCLIIQFLIADLGGFRPCRSQFFPTTKESFASIKNGGAAQFFHPIIPVSIFIQNHAKKLVPYASGSGFRCSFPMCDR